MIIEPRHEKAIIVVSEQVRNKSSCTSTEDGKRLELMNFSCHGSIIEYIYAITRSGKGEQILINATQPEVAQGPFPNQCKPKTVSGGINVISFITKTCPCNKQRFF